MENHNHFKSDHKGNFEPIVSLFDLKRKRIFMVLEIGSTVIPLWVLDVKTGY